MQNLLITTLLFNCLGQNDVTRLKHFLMHSLLKGERDRKFE